MVKKLKVDKYYLIKGSAFRQYWETHEIDGNHYFQIEAKEDLIWLGIDFEEVEIENQNMG